MDNHSLLELLATAEREGWCVNWGCTTCGSRQFRDAILSHHGSEGRLTADGATSVAREICRLRADIPQGPLEFLLRWLSQILGQEQVQVLLGEGEAAELFSRMVEARVWIDARRAEHARRNDHELIEAERARKQAERAEAHRLRLQQKAIRDAERKRQSGSVSG